MAKAITPYFRVSYPNVFKPKLNELNNREEYSVVALFPKGCDMTVLKKAAQEALEEKWGKDQAKWPKNLKTPFRDQGEREKTDETTGKPFLPAGHEHGAIFINIKSQNKPQIIDAQKQEILVESDFYPGCWARASVNAFAYDQKGNRGVAFGLNNLQKVKDGDSLGGRSTADADFGAIEGAGTTDASSLFG